MTAEASEGGDSLVRMTRLAPMGPYCGAVWERYICQPALVSALVSRTSSTTPMTWASPPLTKAIFPIGFWPGRPRRGIQGQARGPRDQGHQGTRDRKSRLRGWPDATAAPGAEAAGIFQPAFQDHVPGDQHRQAR